MSKEQLQKNIRILEAKLGMAGTDWERMIIKNVLTTTKMKLKRLQKGKK